MKKYYKNLDLIRIFACVAVLLYHMGILKGGYLAVCSFFVLSGYLSCVSAFKKEKFDFKNYYKNKFLHLYLPLLIVVLISICAISFIPSIVWLNLKPETNSVLLGYNNFWQLNANLDYFARHVDSPFMHLWYISILLQFDLIFPFIFILLRKIGDKISKNFPIILTFLLGILSTVFFYKASLDNITVAYYNTFARVFALLFGMMIGFASHYKSVIPKKLQSGILSKIILLIYFATWIFLLVIGDANSSYFQIYMIAATLVTMRLINYASLNQKELNAKDKIIKTLASITYEIYLVQYPVIFIFQELEIESSIKIPLIIGIIMLISIILHVALNFKYDKAKFLRIFLQLIVLAISGYGLYIYITSVDHTAEMKALEEQLSQNSKMMEEQQEAYKAKALEEREKWNKMMADLENGEESLKTMVADVPSAFIGDSVMLGAVPNLKNKFKNGYFNAEISRTCYVANDILKELIRKNALGDVIVFNFGANGDCSQSTKETILKTIGENRKLFWLTVTNDKKVHFNDKIKAFAAKYDNLYIIDWENISKGHPEYFYSDGLHLPSPGRKAYTDAVYDAIYQVYLDEFNAKKEAILKEHEEEMKTKISFYGNELLVNAFDDLKDEFKDADFTINNEFKYEEIKAELEKKIADNQLTYRIIFAFDKSSNLTKEEYQNLVDLCPDHEIHIVNMNKEKLTLNNANIIEFYNPSYLMADKIHLTKEGNKELKNKIVEAINKKIESE